MSQISDYLEAKILNATLRGISYTPTSVYVALFFNDPTDAGTGTEMSGGSYARTLVTFAAPVNGIAANSNEVLFPVSTTDWGIITHIGLYDGLTGGNLLYYSPLVYTKNIATGDIFRIAVGNLTVQLS